VSVENSFESGYCRIAGKERNQIQLRRGQDAAAARRCTRTSSRRPIRSRPRQAPVARAHAHPAQRDRKLQRKLITCRTLAAQSARRRCRRERRSEISGKKRRQVMRRGPKGGPASLWQRSQREQHSGAVKRKERPARVETPRRGRKSQRLRHSANQGRPECPPWLTKAVACSSF